ncbi:MAG: hypothetical protein EOO15_20070 [Chitinophagaceae bacterium]|nr:MAG: hypothetical protein EOO15_20070 [Chitinophagaceae bacterium]
MKKFLFLTLLLGGVVSTSVQAQGASQAAAQPKEGEKATATTAATPAPAGADDAAMLQRAKEQQRAPMVDKTGLTDAQADRIIEINFEIRQMARGLKDLNETERSARVAELKALKEKKYSEIPLTQAQIQTVYAYYEEMGKNRQPKTGN